MSAEYCQAGKNVTVRSQSRGGCRKYLRKLLNQGDYETMTIEFSLCSFAANLQHNYMSGMREESTENFTSPTHLRAKHEQCIGNMLSGAGAHSLLEKLDG